MTADSQSSENRTKQTLRLQRFFMSVWTYAACGSLAQICAWLGYLPPHLPAVWMLGALCVNGVFYAMIRSDLNLRLHDPSMTEIQLIVSMFAVMALVYHAEEVRGAFVMLYPVPLLFGALRLRFFKILRVSFVGILGHVVVIAVLRIQHPERVKLDLELVNVLALTGVMLFVALLSGYINRVRAELSRSLEKIGELAQKDSLTGVFNRRHLNDTLEQELQRFARQSRRGLIVCMLDIDKFKAINDSFGHPAGDAVLVAVAQALGQSIRSIDYLARYGGEEFAILLDMAPDDDWMMVCERARAQIHQLRIDAVACQPVTISIGVAHCVDGDSAASLLAQADKALYRAKEEGRNCVRMAKRTLDLVSETGAASLGRLTAA